LVIAANRDEFYQRPTKEAAYWEDHPGIFAGRDLVSNGTWLGVTDAGRFAAVTNYREANQEKGIRSRGALVADFLTGTERPLEYLQTIEARKDDFTGFNLLVGEISESFSELSYYSNRSGAPVSLDDGVYGLSNHLLDTPWPKVVRGKESFKRRLNQKEFDEEELFELMSDRIRADDDELPATGVTPEQERALSPIFIKTPIYGTRCTTVLTISDRFEPRLNERTFV
jgi:uncharacterized protein with NRDE domain